MYSVTSEVKALLNANEPQILRITGTDPNGNAINIMDADVVAGGFSIDRYSSNGSRIEIGTAVASELTLKLNNEDQRFSGIMFEGTELFVEIGVAEWEQADPEITWIPCGYFTVDEQPRNKNIISLSALDRMMNFDRVSPTLSPWTTETGEYMRDNLGNVLYFIAQLSFPATVAELVEQVCARCNVELYDNIDAYPNSTYLIQEMPKVQDDVTFRNLIQWCAGLMGRNAYIDWDGKLRFSFWTNASYDSTANIRFSSDMFENDVMITGVKYTRGEDFYVAGSTEYAIDMSGNSLMDGADETNIQSILQSVYVTLSGFAYRPLEAKVMPAPYLFPMDGIMFEDADGNQHFTILTNVNTTINGATVIKSSGETTQTNSWTAPSTVSPAVNNALRRVLQESNAQLTAAIDSATKHITGAENSNVRFMYDENGALSEILVMDSPDIATAVNVWRWNSGGFGHSSNGYAGPYSLAMTQDGSIVATMITAGILNASVIKAGIIQDLNGLNYWNLETGAFKLSANTQVGNSTIASQGDVDALDQSLTQQNVFNRLTNNGQAQGIYLQNGLLYINGTYIQTGIITSQNNTGTSFNLNNGVLTTVGDNGGLTTYNTTTELGHGTIKIYDGEGATKTLSATMGCGDGTGILYIDGDQGIIITSQHGIVELRGTIYLTGATLYTRDSTTDLPAPGITGTYTVGSGSTIEVRNGIVVGIS